MKFFKKVKNGLVICLVGSVFCMHQHDRQLPIDVQLNQGLWPRVTFTASPAIYDAWKLANLNARIAKHVGGDNYIYHLDTAVVYYLYILIYDSNKNFYVKAKKQLLELLKKHEPTSYIMNCCCYILGADREFLDLYETLYAVEGMTCSIL
ncbi:TPA: hypothetical protein DIC20_03425 [Candidatus Dependentiae bacterium]|nr:MAG: hypothetical protein US03_C0001G0074 [candidate division TM6 bacterium GW2011_GWF2_36_131]KKQ03790.1 MAG: hypothetical protein US13_C0001G0130 [candidate division TM6 bacterium GW2011_GWE2_36_25]KKQ19936.1 MAG: hypothetical protein US32_C0003G0053 [candidate division TM6 bacterium GW2011_GWA2_36_9]HBR70558.1 hypothetical protein [Candidatus Dependentiae bacterium]HCU00726.1 hypothetical protein [Candidatus Dependentiae bacterium]